MFARNNILNSFSQLTCFILIHQLFQVDYLFRIICDTFLSLLSLQEKLPNLYMHSNTWKILMQHSMIRDQQQTFQHASYIIVLWQLEEWENRRIFRHSGILFYDYHFTPRPVYFILHECRFSIILGLTWL